MDIQLSGNDSPETTEAQEAHNAEMAAVGEQLEKNNNPEAVSEERPSWLPEKFESAEAMAEAYNNLESKLGEPKEEAAPEPETEEVPAAEEVEEVLSEKGVDFNTLSNEYAETGELSETTRKQLEEVGFSKEVVDSYIAGQEALASQLTSSVYEQVGGESQFTAMTEWAGDNLSASEVEAFNSAMDSGNMGQVNLAVAGLQAQYVSAVGKEGIRLETRASTTTGDRYESQAQMMQAMADPRYASDPAYRNQVAAKLERSPDF